jgi:hypothetical protein
MADAGPDPRIQRPLAALVLLVAGVLSLPVVAAFLDGESTDQLIVPVQVAVMTVLGAVVGYALPGLARGADRVRGALVGVVVGVVAALIGVAVFFLLLGGV